jgi:hypothetical protein
MPTLLMSKSTSAVFSKLSANGVSPSGVITVLDSRDFLEVYKTEFDDAPPSIRCFLMSVRCDAPSNKEK